MPMPDGSTCKALAIHLTPLPPRAVSLVALLTIPVVSGVVGYITNVIALWMTFYPLEFWPLKLWQPHEQPVGLFGWQGIIPCKAERMSKRFCDTITSNLIDIPAIFAKVDAHVVASLVQDDMQACVAAVVSDVGEQEAPTLWRALSAHVKAEVADAMSGDAVLIITLLLSALQHRVLDVLDLSSLVVSKVAADKAILVNIFQRVGKSEFAFIRNSGLYFGLLLGLPQMLVYYYYQGSWVLPVFGFLVGYATNWIALKLIFSPAEPVNLGCYTLQGLFIKRQEEASAELSKMAQEEFLQQGDLWREIFGGRHRDVWAALVEGVVAQYMGIVANRGAAARLAAALLLGEERLARIRQTVAASLVREMPRMLPKAYAYMEGVMDSEQTMLRALQELPPADFCNILHPVFEEDEIKLILVGGVLGAAAGVVQQLITIQFLS